MARPFMPLTDRLALHSVRSDQGCLLWTGAVTRDGYGTMRVLDGQARRAMPAHVVAFEVAHGPVPPGLDVGHLCHDADRSCPGGPCLHRRCIDLEHIAAQTRSENNRGGRLGDAIRARAALITECVNGHPYDEWNTYARPDRIGRGCRTCRRDARRRCDARRGLVAV